MEDSKLTIKEGYKQTDVGIIPEGWKVEKLENVAPLQRGFDLPSRELKKGVYPVVYSNGILNTHNEYKAKAPGIVTGRSGTIGKVNFIEQNYFPHNTSLWVTDFKGNHPKFVYYLYIAAKLERFGTGSGVPTLNRNDVHLHKVALPPLSEQQAIAEVLSDADALVTSLDRLITKKRNIKQGAMQLLLTGKKRLPSFSGDWETKTLGKIAEIDIDNLKSNTNPDYTFQYISLEDVDVGILRNSTECIFRFAPSRARRKIQKNDVLISTVRPNLKSHLYIENDLKNYICSTGFSVIRCDEKISHARYIYNHFFSDVIDRQINLLLVGSNYPAINSKDIKNLQIPIPTIEEQKAIAQILSDMDAEIESLEIKRNKYKAVKQGMMQELLTGKTRLVKPDAQSDVEKEKAARLKVLDELTEQAQRLNMGY